MGGSNTLLRSAFTFSFNYGPHEGYKGKGRCQGHDQGRFAEALAAETEIKKSECMKIVNSLADIATQQVKSAGIFTIHGLCRIKTRVKPATKAGKREVFGKEIMVKAKPARTIVKAYPVAALKTNF